MNRPLVERGGEREKRSYFSPNREPVHRLHSLELAYGLGSTKNDIFKVIKSAIFIAVSNHKKIKFLAPL